MKTKDERLHAEAVEHGRQACLHLCANLYTALPRELRDFVYDAILGPNPYEHVRHYANVKRPGILGSKGLAFVNKLPHNSSKPKSRSISWWLEEYMGPHVAIEIVESWYRTRTFTFSSISLHMLPKLLEIDAFGKGMEPSVLVQHIRYHINAHMMYDQKMEKRLDSNLRDLVSIKNKNVTLTICIDTTDQLNHTAKATATRTVLGILGPRIYELRAEGFHKLAVRSNSPWKDLTFLFEVPKEDFFKNMVSRPRIH